VLSARCSMVNQWTGESVDGDSNSSTYQHDEVLCTLVRKRGCWMLDVGGWMLEVESEKVGDERCHQGTRAGLWSVSCTTMTPGKTPSQAKHTVGSGRRDRPHFINADHARWHFFGVVTFFRYPRRGFGFFPFPSLLVAFFALDVWCVDHSSFPCCFSSLSRCLFLKSS
jgi:hypothetical protein